MGWVVSFNDVAVALAQLPQQAHLTALDKHVWKVEVEGRSAVFVLLPNDTGLEVWWLGQRYELQVEREQVHALRRHFLVKQQATSEGVVTAHMPGLVTQVKVQLGYEVKRGEGMVVIEAMKMENELRAPKDGIVADLNAQVGQQVEKGHIFCHIVPDAG